MRTFSFSILMATMMVASSAEAAQLVLKRAVLGTGGVGYFEYSADVEADETLTLRARLDQVDDILKSLIILDPAGTGSATLPGKAGAEETFASLPFSQQDLENLPALVAAMKGAEIRLTGPRKIEGRIASVQTETVTSKDGATQTRTRVSVLSGLGIEQFILEEAEGLTFADARLGEQIDTALKAVRASRDRSGRDIAIKLAKGGKRNVRIGYVAEAPVWKAAYRLTLPKDAAAKSRLQGWVVLENMTGNAWKDVAVTLSSAAPVTFRQALYDPYFVTRPQVAPPVSRAALPRGDQGQIALDQDGAGGAARARPARKQAFFAAPAPAQAFSRALAVAAEPEAQEAAPPPPAEAEENTTGASFTLALPVTVGSGESLTIPFVDVSVPAEAVAWYQSGAGRNAWHAVTLKNASAVSMPAGSTTLYETTDAGPLFAGEAQFSLLPAGDSRLLGFGTDQKVLVDRETRSTSMLTRLSVAKGVLSVQSKLRSTTIYRVRNGAPEGRQMVLEHPRQDGWNLTVPAPADATLAGAAYRMRFDVPAGATKSFEVTLEQPVVETIAVGDVTRDRVEGLMASDGLDSETKAKLASISAAAGVSDAAAGDLETLKGQRSGITEDQDRLRENLRAATPGSDLARLYSKKMLDQEKALDDLDAAIKAAEAKSAELRKALADLVSKL